MSRSFTNQTENDVLNWLFGTSTFELQLFTDLPGETGVGTQPSGAANYGAQPIVFGAAAGGVISNSSQVVFPGPTAPWGKIIAWAVKDVTAGIVRATGYMGTFLDSILSVSTAADNIRFSLIAAPPVGTRVFFSLTDPDGAVVGYTASSGIIAIEEGGPDYYVSSSAGGTIRVSATLGGPDVDITDVFYGPVSGWISKTITPGLGDLLVFAPGTISISLK